jgi:endonuclease-3
MSSPNRAALLTKLHKVLKKHYQPVPPAMGRSLLENLLYACCLENAHYVPAEQAYQALSTSFFDWNEVRVSTVKELSEVMKVLPEPGAAAAGLKRSLQGIFEATYSFDLEAWKKQNLGVAVQKLEKCGCSPFVVSYIVQMSLGGHSVPLDSGAMGALAVLAIVPENAKPKDGCPGMERAIPKNKGIEFGSLLHQLAADFYANPYSPKLHATLLEVDSDAKSRLPKRPPKNAKKEESVPPPASTAATTVGKDGKPVAGAKPAAAGDKKVDDKKAVQAKPGDKKPEPPSGKKPITPTPATAKKPAGPQPAKKAPPAAAKKPLTAGKPAAKSSSALAKKKPR